MESPVVLVHSPWKSTGDLICEVNGNSSQPVTILRSSSPSSTCVISLTFHDVVRITQLNFYCSARIVQLFNLAEDEYVCTMKGKQDEENPSSDFFFSFKDQLVGTFRSLKLELLRLRDGDTITISRLLVDLSETHSRLFTPGNQLDSQIGGIFGPRQQVGNLYSSPLVYQMTQEILKGFPTLYEMKQTTVHLAPNVLDTCNQPRHITNEDTSQQSNSFSSAERLSLTEDVVERMIEKAISKLEVRLENKIEQAMKKLEENMKQTWTNYLQGQNKDLENTHVVLS
eukprot:TRINITY_DN11643_c0_g3_i1.p1 TRINITY_DN11643_c0_g3~~TRINITY_DN11643_c0_g3_i1.p1  ORF type:complete len:284 (-),score=47.16 TRINITY_DN11643_c0_g3_i1:421-1272(-)